VVAQLQRSGASRGRWSSCSKLPTRWLRSLADTAVELRSAGKEHLHTYRVSESQA
jgi:hypothetical protein